MSSQRRRPPARQPLHGPGHLEPGPSPGALGRGRSAPGATQRLASRWPRGQRPPGTPATSHPRPPRAGPLLAPPPWRRSASGPARWAVPRGRHSRGRTRSPHTRCAPQSTPARLGTAPRGLGHGGAPPPGGADQRRPHPGPSRSRGRRLGLSVPSAREPASPTAPGKATAHPPGQPLAGPRQAGPALPTPARTRPTCHPGGRGHGSCVRGPSVGHGPPGPRDTVRPQDGARCNPQRSRLPTCMSRDAAPVLVQPSTA
jgi:hypothetical protein